MGYQDRSWTFWSEIGMTEIETCTWCLEFQSGSILEAEFGPSLPNVYRFLLKLQDAAGSRESFILLKLISKLF